MSERTDLLPENELVRRIVALQKIRDEIKGAEQLFGSDSVRTNRLYSPDAYDIQVDNVGFNNRVVELTFTPDQPNSSAIYGLYITAQIAPAQASSVVFYSEAFKPDSNGVKKWRFYLNGSDAFPVLWVRMKFYLYATGSGTFTATLL